MPDFKPGDIVEIVVTEEDVAWTDDFYGKNIHTDLEDAKAEWQQWHDRVMSFNSLRARVSDLSKSNVDLTPLEERPDTHDYRGFVWELKKLKHVTPRSVFEIMNEEAMKRTAFEQELVHETSKELRRNGY